MATIVIPARWASSRFPGKPLAPIKGASGADRPLIEWSWQAAKSVPGDHRVVVATDDRRIVDTVEQFGGEAVLTPEDCENGTARVAAFAGEGDPDEIFVNFQGDALLTPPDYVAGLIALMEGQPALQVATVGVRCVKSTYDHLVADQAAGRVGGTTLVCNAAGHAMYFSKRVLPYIHPDHVPAEGEVPAFLHLGLYAYRRSALITYNAAPVCTLEKLEGLEQLRFLYLGQTMHVLACDPPGWDAIELNNPTDIDAIEANMKVLELD